MNNNIAIPIVLVIISCYIMITIQSPVCPRSHDGVPELSCAHECYQIEEHTCCQNVTYAKGARSPCANNLRGSRSLHINPDWDEQVSFLSAGMQYPPYDANSFCTWHALNDKQAKTYEVYNCTAFVGSGSFNFNETYYTLSFSLPPNTNSYSTFELDVYINNTLGKNQTIVLATFAQPLKKNYNIESNSTNQYPCDSFRVFTPIVHSVNFTVQQGFSGYKTINVAPLVAWALDGNTPHSLQLSLSTFNSCTCLESNGQCIVTIDCSCSSEDYHIQVSGSQAQHYRPYLVLDV